MPLKKSIVKSTNLKSITKDTPFEKYLSQDELFEGFKKDLIRGSLRVNPRNYQDAYVTHPKFDSDISIREANKNRALFDDIVAVKIFSKSQWKVNVKQFIDDGLLGEDKAEILRNQSKNSVITLEILLKNYPKILEQIFKSNNNNQIDFDDNQDFPNEFNKWWMYFQRTGKVVSIVNKLNARICFGTLQKPLQYAKTVKFSPLDKKFPRIDIPIEFCPADYALAPEYYKDVKFIVEITEWNHDRERPLGKISTCLQNLDAYEQECLKILSENGINDTTPDFGCLVGDNTDNKIPSKLSELDHKFRKDFRKDPAVCVISIDPKTARDLDDALHIKPLGKDKDNRMLYEVGVHIADVTYYMPDDHPIDIEARSRCTTVYLVNRAIAMLPRELCEQMCSLTPGTDKACYSVIYKVAVRDNIDDKINEMDDEDDSPGEVEFLDTWYGRSLINSSAQLSYEDAQEMIDNPNKDWKDGNRIAVFNNFNYGDIANSVLCLNKLSRILRYHRFQNGSLAINQPQIGFELSQHDKATPIGFKHYKLNTSNHLIEEWMLCANMSVATLLHDKLPEYAFLRWHPAPTKQSIENLNKELVVLGFANLQIDCCTSAAMSNLVNAFDEKSPEYLAILNLCSKILQLALYMCNGIGHTDNSSILPKHAPHNDDDDVSSGHANSTHHFALNVPLYTHFTSPIRRYADVIVHRQLTRVLLNEEQEKLERATACGDANTANEIQQKIDWLSKFAPRKDIGPSELGNIAELCNKKRKDAKVAQEASQYMYYTIFVQKCGPFEEDAWVSGVLDKAFDILLTKTGFIKRAYCDQMNLSGIHFNKKANSLRLSWMHAQNCNDPNRHPRPETILTFGSQVTIVVSAYFEDKNTFPKVKFTLKNPGCKICFMKCGFKNKIKRLEDFENPSELVDDESLYKMLDDV